MLAHDDIGDVRCSVARNIKTPAETLYILAHDEYSHVRYLVAKNPKANEITRIILAQDKDYGVVKAALKTIN